MELVNFSQEESDLVNKALAYVPTRQVPLQLLPKNTQLIKSTNFFSECEELAAYSSGLGLENSQARIVFTSAKGDGHKILLNADTVQCPGLAHVVLVHLTHLAHFIQYGEEHGNVHRYGPEEAVNHFYYEFLLWTKFRAMAISAKVNALLAWHELHGAETPQDGCYCFSDLNFHGQDLAAALERFSADDKKERGKTFWPLLERFVAYLGGLACYQRVAQPQKLDINFPEALTEKALGLNNTLALYSALLRAERYEQWKEEKQGLRRAVVALREWCKHNIPD